MNPNLNVSYAYILGALHARREEDISKNPYVEGSPQSNDYKQGHVDEMDKIAAANKS